MKTKLCRKCLCQKPVDEFLQTAHKGVFHKSCAKCRSSYYKTYNKQRYASAEAREAELKRGREKYARLTKQARHTRKKELIMLMGGKCSMCGYNRSASALDFDHIDPKTKSRTLSHLLANNHQWAWDEAKKEAEKCRLLCSNCHREITFPGHELGVMPMHPPDPKPAMQPDPTPPVHPDKQSVGSSE